TPMRSSRTELCSGLPTARRAPAFEARRTVVRLSDEQWERIREHFPEENIPEGRAGRKPVPAREVLEAVLWILNTGAQWHMLPQCYPHYKTAHRRFQIWCRSEVLRQVLTDIANELRDRGALDQEECFI